MQVTGAGAVTLGALPTTTVSKGLHRERRRLAHRARHVPGRWLGHVQPDRDWRDLGVTGFATFTIAPAGATSVAANGNTGTPGELAFTGGTISTLGLWAAGGAIVLGGGLLVVRKSVRRQRETV